MTVQTFETDTIQPLEMTVDIPPQTVAWIDASREALKARIAKAIGLPGILPDRWIL